MGVAFVNFCIRDVIFGTLMLLFGHFVVDLVVV